MLNDSKIFKQKERVSAAKVTVCMRLLSISQRVEMQRQSHRKTAVLAERGGAAGVRRVCEVRRPNVKKRETVGPLVRSVSGMIFIFGQTRAQSLRASRPINASVWVQSYVPVSRNVTICLRAHGRSSRDFVSLCWNRESMAFLARVYARPGECMLALLVFDMVACEHAEVYPCL